MSRAQILRRRRRRRRRRWSDRAKQKDRKFAAWIENREKDLDQDALTQKSLCVLRSNKFKFLNPF